MPLEVKPKSWVLPNRVGFLQWVYRTFHPDMYPMAPTAGTTNSECACSGTSKCPTHRSLKLFPAQRFVRDFMQFDSPYRGILLFHGLGSGKTASSLAAAEGFLKRHKKVWIMLPASLAPNYRKEILSHAYLSFVKRGAWHHVNINMKDDDEVERIISTHGVGREWLVKKKGKVWIPIGRDTGRGKGEAPATEIAGTRWKDLSDDARDSVSETLDNMIDERFGFIHYNGITRDALDKLTERKDGKDVINPFDNSFVVIDEAHNFISRVTNRRQISYRIYKLLMKAKNMKIVLLSGTPMINHPFELCYMMNLARGPLYSQSWVLSKGTRDLTAEINTIIKKDRVLSSMVDGVSISRQGKVQTLALSLLPPRYRFSSDNGPNQMDVILTKQRLMRTDMEKRVLQVLVSSGVFPQLIISRKDGVDDVVDMDEVTTNSVLEILNGDTKIASAFKGARVTLDKRGKNVFLSLSINEQDEALKALMSASSERVHLTLRAAGFEVHPHVQQHAGLALPDDKEGFRQMFMEEYTEDDEPRARIRNHDLFTRRIMGIVSYYRSTGDDLFPAVTGPVFEEVPMSDYQYGKYLEVRYRELHMEIARKRQMRGKAAGLFDNKGSVYRAFSRMLCNFAFPEMKHKRLYPMDVRVSLRREIDLLREDGEMDTYIDKVDNVDKVEKDKAVETVETEAVKKVLDKQDAMIHQAVRTRKAKENTIFFSTGAKEENVQKVYDLMLNKALKELEERADEFLSDDGLRTYSPKFFRMLGNLDISPGKCLMYSQFRNVEGLGIFSLVLNHHQWSEIRLHKVRGAYRIANAKRVMRPEYDGKRYIRFPEDRAEQKILLNIFNGAYDNLPGGIKTDLLSMRSTEAGSKAEVEAGANGKLVKNLRGELAKLIMITQSGAEGISLKNVRQVHITESFWQSVRIDQVIGRAVRACSHESLPKEERSVQVFMYVSTFTEKQASDFTIRQTDHGLTSDQHLLDLAKRKDDIVGQFLQMLKSASVDCMRNASYNKPREQGFTCYTFPLQFAPKRLAFEQRLDKELQDSQLSQNIRTREWKGVPVKDATGKKYVRHPITGKLFEYDAYVDAGVLIPKSKKKDGM